jgi:hypothetical protein
MNPDKNRIEVNKHTTSGRLSGRSSAPKAQNMIAQGNALGCGSQKLYKP